MIVFQYIQALLPIGKTDLTEFLLEFLCRFGNGVILLFRQAPVG